MAEPNYADRYKAYQRDQWVSQLVMIPFLALIFVVAIPSFGTPGLEGFGKLILIFTMFGVSQLIFLRMRKRSQSKHGLVCPKCRNQPSIDGVDKDATMRGECPRCLSSLGQ